MIEIRKRRRGKQSSRCFLLLLKALEAPLVFRAHERKQMAASNPQTGIATNMGGTLHHDFKDIKEPCVIRTVPLRDRDNLLRFGESL